MTGPPEIQTEFRYQVHTVRSQWIGMPDGTKLSARLRLPVTDEPVPAVLEHLPYRKNDGTLARDNLQHNYLAGHGIACVRVDIRGSGDSDGVLEGEYLEAELQDAAEVIEWIAEQPWCNGNVGMMGISWGGFNSLQVAAKKPPALKAVVSVASTADRYATDVHYKGGCVLAGDMLAWSATMLCFNARPPTKRVVGKGWRQQWLERVEATPVFVDDWLTHQHRDEFWKHGSVCEDYAVITCPVMIVGGLADGYTDTAFHVVEGLSSSRGGSPGDTVRGIVGPWSHNYPAVGVPGPNIGFLQEIVDWFKLHLDHHGVVAAAGGASWNDPVRIWLQDSVPPSAFYQERPGRWISEPTWPSPNVASEDLWLDLGAGGPGHQDGALLSEPPSETSISGSNNQTCGLRQGGWWGYAQPGQLPDDQRREEPAAFRFVGPPTEEALAIVGIPKLHLTLSADAPQALVAARLCDMAPDGSSLQLSRGVLNLCHRMSHESPEAVVPGEIMTVEVVMDGVAHSLPAGHHLELHIGTTLWPLVWPSPTPVNLTLNLGPDCRLALPIRQVTEAETDIDPFGPPITADSETTVSGHPLTSRTITDDLATGMVSLVDHSESGDIEFAEGGDIMSSTATDTWMIDRHDPLTAWTLAHRTWTIRWADHDVPLTVTAIAEMRCDEQWFYTTSKITLTEGDTELLTKSGERRFLRQHV